MNTDTFLNELRKLRSALFTIRVGDFFKKQDEETRQKFSELKIEVMNLVDTLEIADLQSIADDLAQNEQAFKDGIDKLKEAIAELEKAVKIINTVGKVIEIATKIAGPILGV